MLGEVLIAIVTAVFAAGGLYLAVGKARRRVELVRAVRQTTATDIDAVESGDIAKVKGTARAVEETVTTPLDGSKALVYKYEKQHWESDENHWDTESETTEAVPFQVKDEDGNTITVVETPSEVVLTEANTERTFEGNPETADVGVESVGVTVAETYERGVSQSIADGDSVVVYGPASADEDDSVVLGHQLLESDRLVVMDSEEALPSVRDVVVKYGAIALFMLFVLVVAIGIVVQAGLQVL